MTEHENADKANVIVLPPLIYLGFFLVGVGLQYVWTIKLMPRVVQTGIGLGLVGLSFLITLLAIPEFHKMGTSIDVNKPANALITTGAYRFSRNPLYLALAIMHVGLAVLIDNFWAVLMVIPTLIVVTHSVIAREEAYLEMKFGENYRNYKAKVSRWL